MKIFRISTSDCLKVSSTEPCVLTIGNFDGIHLGHQKIINQVKEVAKQKKLKSAVLTFEPHPAFFFKKNQSENFLITSFSQKLKIFREKKIDYVFVAKFNQNFSEIEADFFVKNFLIKNLRVSYLLIGYDFSFGKNKKGNYQFLQNFFDEKTIFLQKIDAVKVDQKIYSSSLIRNFISEGKISFANSFLGRNFFVEGFVVKGKKLAQKLGFPTINVKLKKKNIRPKFGVYKTIISIEGFVEKFLSITNFGIKPTFDNSKIDPLFETYIPNFSHEIYGKKVKIEFIDFIRNEKKFSSAEELKKQIRIDLKSIN
jgi:riboflavin kinase/FMN adenylyltransferase